MKKYVKLSLGEQRMFPLTEGTVQEEGEWEHGFRVEWRERSRATGSWRQRTAELGGIWEIV